MRGWHIGLIVALAVALVAVYSVPARAAATLLVPWYNDAGGTSLLSSFITVFNNDATTVTVTVSYSGTAGQGATPAANTYTIGPGASKAGRPFQVSGAGEGTEVGPPTSMPNAASGGAFGSATFVSGGAANTLVGDTLRMGVISGLGAFSGIAPGVSS